MGEAVLAATIGAVIPSLVTAIGLFVTYRRTRRDMEATLAAQKEQRTLEIAGDLPARVADLMDDALAKTMDVREMNRLLTDVYVYGSPEAVRLVVAFQRHNYALAAQKEPAASAGREAMAILALLIAQLKLDMTGKAVPAAAWAEMKLRDYDDVGGDLSARVERIARQHGLDPRFYKP